MAGCPQADLKRVAPRPGEPELGIERGNSKDLILGDAQIPGNIFDRLWRNIAEFLLNVLENRDEILRFSAMFHQYCSNRFRHTIPPHDDVLVSSHAQRNSFFHNSGLS